MTNNTSYPELAPINNIHESLLNNLRTKITDAFNDSELISETKYTEKMKLIESATDMSTQEKLDAMDNNYDRRNQECWQNIATFAIISLGIIGIAVGSPVAFKSIYKCFAA
jgi:hypothetical protein